MRIGFDAKRAFMNSSGLGNYSRTLIGSLLDNFPGHEYVAFTPAITNNLGNELTATGKLKVVLPPKLLSGLLSSWWRSSMISEDISAQHLDIFHGLSNELPKHIPFSTKKVVTIHDLIFLRHPEWYPFIDRNIYYKKFRYACKNADVVVTVSEQTRQDVFHYFNTAEEKVKVIYQSCSDHFFQCEPGNVLMEFKADKKLPEKYILYVGTIEERKNLFTLVQALVHVEGISLVVIGSKKKYFEKVKAFIDSNGLQERIIFPAATSARELKHYYQAAAAFVYPSRYEGFGIPVIEALSSRVPVITSDTPALKEAGGPGTIYIHPDDAVTLATKLNQVLQDSTLREKMISDGLIHVKQFHSKETSAQMMKLYNSIHP